MSMSVFRGVGGRRLLQSVTSPSSSSSSPILPVATQRRFYHESVIDHFNNPRNVGKMDSKSKNVGSAVVGKASCGDVIKLQIEVDDSTGKIKDAKFKTFGCGSAIASSSLVTEMIKGKSLNEAERITNKEISSHLNLPPVKIHCSVLAEEAVHAAIKDWEGKQGKAATQ